MPTLNSTCDTIPVFGGGPPPSAGAYVALNGVQLIPSPFVNLVVEKYKVGEKTIGGVLKLTLNGTIVASSFNDIVDGGTGGTTIQSLLCLAQLKGSVCVEIKCDSTLVKGCGRIISVSVNEGNQPTWVQIAPYSIEIEVYENTLLTDNRIVIPDIESDDDNVLKNISESLSWNIGEETFDWGFPSGTNPLPVDIDGFGNRHIKVNFNISVAGVAGASGCNCGGGEGGAPSELVYGLAAAEDYLDKRLKDLRIGGPDSLFDMNSYEDPFDPLSEIEPTFKAYIGGDSYLNFRNIEINPVENSITVGGEIIYRPSGCKSPDVFTTLNIEHNITVDEETLTISGNITGLVDNDFNKIIKLDDSLDNLNCKYNGKIDRAEKFLKLINDPEVIKNIADEYVGKNPYPKGHIEDDCEYSATPGVCEPTSATPPPVETCSTRIISSQISRNISAGEINFTFNLSNAPNCDILGASKVNVDITHDRPHDNIVEIVIPGRGSRGPLIQNICCNSAEKYDISIDASLNKKTCNFDIKKQTIEALRKCTEDQLDKLITEDGIDISCWFKVNDVETISNTSFKSNRSYVKPSCP